MPSAVEAQRVMVPDAFVVPHVTLQEFFEPTDSDSRAEEVHVEELILEQLLVTHTRSPDAMTPRSSTRKEKHRKKQTSTVSDDEGFQELCVAFSHMTCPWMIIKTRQGIVYFCDFPRIYFELHQKLLWTSK